MNMPLRSYKTRAFLLTVFFIVFVFSVCGSASADISVNYISSIAVNGSPVRLATDAFLSTVEVL